MFLLLIVTLIYVIILQGYGFLIQKLLNPQKLVSFDLLNGLIVVGILSTVSAIFFPLNFYYELFVLILGLILALYSRFWTRLKPILSFKKSFYFLLVLSAFVASMNAYIFDTFTYYLPTIKWLDDYGFVTGLVNFDFNLGQNSMWHILQASFNQTIDQNYKLNLIITIIYILYLYEIKKEIFLIFLPVFYLFIASPSPDLPVFVISIMLVLNHLKNKNLESIQYGLIGSAFIVLVKPIAFVLAIYFFIIALINFRKNIDKKVLLLLVGVTGLFFIKNIILTANITFPLVYGNLNFLDHAISEQIYYLSGIDGKYLITSRVVPVVYEDFETWTTKEYYIYIFNNLHLSVILYLVIGLVMFLFLGFSIYKKDKKLILLASLLVLKVIIFWIISIQYRFILDGLLIVMVIWFYHFKIKPIIVITTVLFASLIFMFGNKLPLLKNIYFMSAMRVYNPKNVLKPNNYKLKFKKEKFSNFEVNRISNTVYSIDVAQPALSQYLINYYSYKCIVPIAVDSSDYKKGFISKIENY